MLTVNELGEFSLPDVPDPDANRAKAYASCIKVKPIVEGEPSIAAPKPADRVCDICGRPFRARQHNQMRCSSECKKEAQRRNRRKKREEGKR